MTESKPTPLDLARFADLLDSYGADFARWPDETREPARRLLEADPEAHRLHRAALQLDMLLDRAPASEAPPDLRARVLEIPIRHAQRHERAARFFGLRWAAFALVPCMIGFVSGTLWLDPPNELDDDAVAWNEVADIALPNDVFDEEWP